MTKPFLLAFLMLPSLLFAQDGKKKHFVSRTTHEVGAVLASNGSSSSLALSINQYWGFGKNKKNFKVGLGARLTSSVGGRSLEYITAPAILTSGKTGPGVFFAEQIPQNIDTVSLNGTQVNALNLYLALRYDFAKKWGVEFNIDLAGVSLGGSKKATLLYGDGVYATQSTTAKPTLGNVLLISDNDLGSLNSEFMISYNLKPKIKLKAGASFLFNEYTLDNPVNYVNTLGTQVNADRYRTKMLMFGVGTSILF